MDPFSNYRRQVPNWGNNSEPRPGLLPNPSAIYGRQQNEPPPQNFGFQRQFNTPPGPGIMPRYQTNFQSGFKREFQPYPDEPGRQAAFNRPSFQEPQPLLSQPRYEPFRRWDSQNPRNSEGDNWKNQKRGNQQQRFNKNKPKQNNWGKKRQRNPSNEDKNKKLHTDENDCWNSDGGVFVIDDELEQSISSSKKSEENSEVTIDENQIEDKIEDVTIMQEIDPDDGPANTMANNKSQNSFAPNIPGDRRAERFYCALCDAKCGNENNYRFHCEGNRHLRNLNASKGIPMSPRKSLENTAPQQSVTSGGAAENTPEEFNENVTEPGIPKPQISVMQSKLNSYQAPLIGLNYIIELQAETQFGEPKYECSLCDSKCDSTNLLAHVTGSEHRMTYMDKHHKIEYDRLSNSQLSKDEFAVELIRAVEKIQRSDGRGQIQTGYEKPSTSSEKSKKWVFKEPTSLTPTQYYLDLQRAKWKDNEAAKKDEYFTTDSYDGFDKDDTNQTNSEIQPPIEESNAEDENPFNKILDDDPENLSLSKGSLGALLRVLSKCEVKNEEDAQMALQVSNALTASLFKYRVQSMSSECVQALNSNLSGSALKLLVNETKPDGLASSKPSDQL